MTSFENVPTIRKNLKTRDGGASFKTALNPTAATGITMNVAEVPIKMVEITFSDTELSMPVDTDAFNGLELFSFPDGNVMIVGGEMSFTATAGAGAINDDADLLTSIGTTKSTDATLGSTDANIIASNTDTMASGVATVAGSGATQAMIATSSTSVFLNAAVAAADLTGTTTDTLTLSGSAKVFYFDGNVA